LPLDLLPRAVRDYKKLPPLRSLIEAIDQAIEELKGNPRPPGAIKLTAQGNEYRVRVGDYRIIYEIQDPDRVIVLRIVKRNERTY